MWRNVLLFVAIGKAAVAGAGLAMAMLGVADLASAIGARPLLDFINKDHILDIAALGGGVTGAAFRLLWAIIARP